MARPRFPISVSSADQLSLRRLLSRGVQQVRVFLRALVLLQLRGGVAAPQFAELLPDSRLAARRIGHRYQDGGLDRAVYD
jgi:hypothetical protein